MTRILSFCLFVFWNLDFHEYQISFLNTGTNKLQINPFISSLKNDAHNDQTKEYLYCISVWHDCNTVMRGKCSATVSSLLTRTYSTFTQEVKWCKRITVKFLLLKRNIVCVSCFIFLLVWLHFCLKCNAAWIIFTSDIKSAFDSLIIFQKDHLLFF